MSKEDGREQAPEDGGQIVVRWGMDEARAMYESLRKCWHSDPVVNEFIAELGEVLGG